MNFIYDNIIYIMKSFWGGINKQFYKKPNILDTISSLEKIINEKCSVSRFGDGEINLLLGEGETPRFQGHDKRLQKKLKEVLKSDIQGLEIGLPDVFGNLSDYEKASARYWRAYLSINRKKISELVNYDYTYINTNMTRFWSGYRKKEDASVVIQLFKKIWNNRDVIFIEGALTRMGVGNDLFDNAKSTRRIICPAENAWKSYELIYRKVSELKFDKNVLFILALGPTATVLAHDLAIDGFQALDLGHIDVQYEYYLRKANGKISLPGKYVNENVNGTIVTNDIIDRKYTESIILRIE